MPEKYSSVKEFFVIEFPILVSYLEHGGGY